MTAVEFLTKTESLFGKYQHLGMRKAVLLYVSKKSEEYRKQMFRLVMLNCEFSPVLAKIINLESRLVLKAPLALPAPPVTEEERQEVQRLLDDFKENHPAAETLAGKTMVALLDELGDRSRIISIRRGMEAKRVVNE